MENILNELLNYTPHEVCIIWKDSDGNEQDLRIPPQPEPIRLDEIDTDLPAGGWIPFAIRRYGSSNLPTYQPGVILIVSHMVASQFPTRMDLCYPAADIRNDKGQVIGTTKLCRVP
jgi:hypothetical protein